MLWYFLGSRNCRTPASQAVAWDVPAVTVEKTSELGAVSVLFAVPANEPFPPLTSIEVAWNVPTVEIAREILPDAVVANWDAPATTVDKSIGYDPASAAWGVFTLDVCLKEELPDAITVAVDIPELLVISGVLLDSVAAAWAVPAVTVEKSFEPDALNIAIAQPDPRVDASIPSIEVSWAVGSDLAATKLPFIVSPNDVSISVPAVTVVKSPPYTTPTVNWGVPRPITPQFVFLDPITVAWDAPAAHQAGLQDVDIGTQTVSWWPWLLTKQKDLLPAAIVTAVNPPTQTVVKSELIAAESVVVTLPAHGVYKLPTIASVTVGWNVPAVTVATTANAAASQAINWAVPAVTVVKSQLPAAISIAAAVPAVTVAKATQLSAVSVTWAAPTPTQAKILTPAAMTVAVNVPLVYRNFAEVSAVTASWNVPALTVLSTVDLPAISVHWQAPTQTKAKVELPAALTDGWEIPQVAAIKIRESAGTGVAVNVPAVSIARSTPLPANGVTVNVPSLSSKKDLTLPAVSRGWNVPAVTVVKSKSLGAIGLTWDAPQVDQFKLPGISAISVAVAVPAVSTPKAILLSPLSVGINQPLPTRIKSTDLPEPPSVGWAVAEPLAIKIQQLLAIPVGWDTPAATVQKVLLLRELTAHWGLSESQTTGGAGLGFIVEALQADPAGLTAIQFLLSGAEELQADPHGAVAVQ